MEKQPIIIQIDTPVVNKQEFCRRTGMGMDLLNLKISKGEIPILPKKGKEGVLINMALYWKKALAQPY